MDVACSRFRLQDTEITYRQVNVGSEGERKPVTILFADIAGSTSIAEKLDPEEWKEVVQGAHRRVSAAVERYGGMVAQYLGDGALAFFGAPVTHEDDPERAVRAALDLQTKMRDYRHELAGLVEDFQVRVGIHAGEVVLGEVGQGAHTEYLAIGDAVNVAARLQSAAEPGGILISTQVQRGVAHAFELEGVGELELKGKTEKIATYRVVGAKAQPEVARGLPGTQSSFVGRELELERLGSALVGLLEGQGGIVAVLGEAGIGKTRLVEEARRRFSTHPSSVAGYSPEEVRWLEGRALSYGGALSNWVITQLLLDDLGLADGAPEVRIKVALRKRVEALFGDEADDHWPYLAHLFELSLDNEDRTVLQNMDSESRRYQTRVVLRRYFEKAAGVQPLVIALEDLHWADPSSMEVLEELLGLLDRVPLLLVMLMRVDHDHGSWALTNKARTDYPHRYEEIHLHRLLAVDSTALIAELLGQDPIPDGLEALIQSRAEGNPLYVEEVIRHLKENGLLVQETDGWILTRKVETIGIPETLQGVLLARIDRLEAGVRETLQLASVIGRSFLYRILEAISLAEAELDSHLTELQRSELVREKARLPELEYIFKHALTQEAAYSSLLVERRKAFHKRVGEAIESIFEDRREEYLGLLAHHFERAGIQQKAASYLDLAGDRARLDDAFQEADDFYGREIEMLFQTGDEEKLAYTWMKRALVYHQLSAFNQAHQAYSVAFDLLEKTAGEKAAHSIRASEGKREKAVLNIPITEGFVKLNLGEMNYQWESQMFRDIFAGLVEIDADLNIIPHVAKSWEILDEGKRYIFHLRDDVFWSDGEQVTAEDFIWTWFYRFSPKQDDKRNIWFKDIVGLEEYRSGSLEKKDEVGFRALDPYTIELLLKRPSSYILYLMSTPLGYPWPRRAIKKHADEWWKPPHVVSNGAFLFKELDDQGIVIERNPKYFQAVGGNLDVIRWEGYKSEEAIKQSYHEDKCDMILGPRMPMFVHKTIAPNELHLSPPILETDLLVLNSTRPPTDRLEVRQAIAHAVRRTTFVLEYKGSPPALAATGGIIPPGMPGHSPGLALEHDLARAQDYISQARKRRKGATESLLLSGGSDIWDWLGMFRVELEQDLGLKATLHKMEARSEMFEINSNIQFISWSADFPAPVNFLVHCAANFLKDITSWFDEQFEGLVSDASAELDHKNRMALYRAADRYLVHDQVLIIPLGYGGSQPSLVKPWITNFHRDALYFYRLKDLTIDLDLKSKMLKDRSP